MDEYEVIKKTNCGVWVQLCPGVKKFINTNAKKQFAYATKEAALIGFKNRKQKHFHFLKKQIVSVVFALELIQRIENEQ